MKESRITNLGLIAYLQTQGFFPVRRQRVPGHQFIFFHFESTPELHEEINKFLNGKALADPQALFAHYTNLQRLVRDIKAPEEVPDE